MKRGERERERERDIIGKFWWYIQYKLIIINGGTPLPEKALGALPCHRLVHLSPMPLTNCRQVDDEGTAQLVRFISSSRSLFSYGIVYSIVYYLCHFDFHERGYYPCVHTSG